MTAVHLLVETGRAGLLAAYDQPFTNGQAGSEALAEVACPACRAMFPSVALGTTDQHDPSQSPVRPEKPPTSPPWLT